MILVTGAAGFVGREVCRQLCESGHSVVGLDRAASGERQAANLAGIKLTELIEEDLLQVDLRSLLRDVTAIVHLAGSPGVQTSWSTGFETHLDNNVLTTQRLAEAMLDVPVKRMVVASSSSVYGHTEPQTPNGTPEDQTLRPISPYGASKAAMEHVVGAYIHRGLNIIPLRYFTIYGPHQRPDMAMNMMIESLRSGRPFTLRGDGEQRRNFTFVADAASATVSAITADVKPGTPINVGGNGSSSVNEVINLLSELHGSPVPVAEVARVAGDPQRTDANIIRSARLLRWTPQVGLREGLAAQLMWQLGNDLKIGRTNPGTGLSEAETRNPTTALSAQIPASD